jgi:zinc protease
VPSNFLELLLWLESDRMGFLLPAMDQEKLDNQRAVVQNERRQNYENQPYGLAFETMAAALYPAGHPYSWITIGSMADLNAASLEDVEHFFRTYYVPNNAYLSIVGDFDPAEAKRLVVSYFGEIPRGAEIERPQPAPVRIEQPRNLVLEDRVQLPRLYMAWLTPALYADGDADLDVLARVLTSGRTSRLYRRLVYEEQIAQFVFAGQTSRPLAGQFGITIQARPGVPLRRIQEVVDEEIARLRTDPPTQREIQQALNNIEAGFIQRFQTNLGKADALNLYATYAGSPGYVENDLARYFRVTPASVLAAAERYLSQPRVMLSVVPQGRTNLAVE